MPELLRLSKLMSQRGLCSRREADKLIEQGLVKVDGKAVDTLGLKVFDTVKIELTQRAKKIQSERITIMLNKPVGYVSGQAEEDYVPAVRLISEQTQSEIDRTGLSLKSDCFRGLAPAGRLDIDSQGLLVLTQDGRIAKKLIGEDSRLEKEYLVRVDGDVSESVIKKLCFGLELDGKPLRHAKVRQLNDDQLQFILREGKKRQIRRMCDAVGLHVKGLKRVRVGELRLGKLAEGEWRFVLPEEFEHRAAKTPASDNTWPKETKSDNQKRKSKGQYSTRYAPSQPRKTKESSPLKSKQGSDPWHKKRPK